MTTAGVLLAAGHSRRFGPTNKLLATLRGIALVDHAARAMRASGVDVLLAVVSDDAVAARLNGFDIVRPPEPVPAQSDSLRAGVAAAALSGSDRVLIALGDMPFVTSKHLRAVMAQCDDTIPSATTDGTRPTPPACFPRIAFGALLALNGDRGAGAMLADLPDDALVRAPTGMLRDLDTRDDFDAAAGTN